MLRRALHVSTPVRISVGSQPPLGKDDEGREQRRREPSPGGAGVAAAAGGATANRSGTQLLHRPEILTAAAPPAPTRSERHSKQPRGAFSGEDQEQRVDEDVEKFYFIRTGQADLGSTRVITMAMSGNMLITLIKGLATLSTGSSAMLAETVHSLVDTGNQGLLYLGARQAAGAPDKKHQYGYGRAAYFWSLVSALGMFWLGAGVTVSHGLGSLLNPGTGSLQVGWEVWGVLGCSFVIDGVVLLKVVRELQAGAQSKGLRLREYLGREGGRDPFLMAVLLEDAAACAGVLVAGAGIGLAQATGVVAWDSLASIAIGVLLGGVAVHLVRLNQRFLMGKSIEPEMELEIREMLLARPGIDAVHAVQSQWLGPKTFSFKAEVDFDGTFLAAQLFEQYRDVFLASAALTAGPEPPLLQPQSRSSPPTSPSQQPLLRGGRGLEEDLPVLLAWYAEDVTRLVEKEVKDAENEIRSRFPAAAFIELEPDSTDTHKLAGAFASGSRTRQRACAERREGSGEDHLGGRSSTAGGIGAATHATTEEIAGCDDASARSVHDEYMDEFTYDQTRRSEEEAFRRALVELAMTTEAAASKAMATQNEQEQLSEQEGRAEKARQRKKREGGEDRREARWDQPRRQPPS
jgi:zinc transporter 9